MRILPTFVILSAERTNLPAHENSARTVQLEIDLIKAGFKPTKCLGCYQGNKEASYLVPVVRGDGGAAYEILQHIAKDFNQACILYRDANGAAWLDYLNNEPFELLGEFTEVNEKEAHESGNYTFVNGRYFTTE